jgi:hypothetical protein
MEIQLFLSKPMGPAYANGDELGAQDVPVKPV